MTRAGVSSGRPCPRGGYVNISGVRGIAMLVLVVGVSVADSAAASQSASIQAVLNRDGTGTMVANSQANGSGETWSWQACAPGGSGCVPFATGREVSTGAAKPNTVFVATASDGPTARSPVWHGNVSATSPPGASGAVRANALVTPVAGAWSGGWDEDRDLLQLAACTSPDGTNCTSLTDPPYYQGCAHAAAVIDVAFTGRYLRVADQRLAADTVFAAIALRSPYGSQTWAAGPTTSVAVLGRIAPASGPRAAACGPPPLLSATLSRQGVATVRCAVGCTVVLQARRRSRLHSYRVRLDRVLPAPGSVTMRLPAEALRRLGHGRVAFSVEIDGTPFATRTVNLG
jgi:hypothetical protein